MDYDLNVNQKIKGKFVEQHVYSNVGTMVEYILKRAWEDREAPFSYDDIENVYPDNSDEIDELEEKIEELENKISDIEDKISELEYEAAEAEDDESIKLQITNLEAENEKLGAEKDELEEEKTELESQQETAQDIFEWWLVSDYLCRKLKEKGEPVISDENLWGRTCSGQAIKLDGVIGAICSDMQILAGQKYEWKD